MSQATGGCCFTESVIRKPTTLAYDSPKNVRLATALLGHTNLKTTEKHYNQARQVEAGRKLNGAMSSLRKRLA